MVIIKVMLLQSFSSFFETTIDGVGNFLTSIFGVYNFFVGNIKDISVFDVLIISDGIHNTYKYISELIVIKITNDTLNENSKKQIIENYKKLYDLAYFDRYVLYILVYIFCSFLQNVIFMYFSSLVLRNIIFMGCFVLSFPKVQSIILNIKIIDVNVTSFIEKKNNFLHYSLSKTIIRFLQRLSSDIIDIQNLHIFVLYNYLTLEYIWEFIKNFVFIVFLNVIRRYQSTYYYYKAIKLSYYYNTGYLYNIIGKNDAVSLINSLIKKKQWGSLCKIEVVNAIYSLWIIEFNIKSDWVELNLILIRVFSIWSVLSLLKIFNITFVSYIFGLYIASIYIINIKNKNKHFALCVLIYTLLLLNINELIISVVFIKYNIIYESIGDFVFFITNYRQLKKVLNFYSRQPLLNTVASK